MAYLKEIGDALNLWVADNQFYAALFFAIEGALFSMLFDLRSKAEKLGNTIQRIFKYTDKSKTEQSAHLDNSPNSVQQNAVRDAINQPLNPTQTLSSPQSGFNQAANVIVNHIPEPTASTREEALTLQATNINVTFTATQSHISEKVPEVLGRLNNPLEFFPRFQNAIRHLNNGNISICASEYHSSFTEVVPILLAASTYTGQSVPSENDLQTLSNNFNSLREFMSNSSSDDAGLRSILTSFENSLLVILGYL